MRMHLYAALGTLRTGLDILFQEEGVRADVFSGHGGLFKTKDVGQSIVAAAVNTPVSVMEGAGEGGAWGIALLAAYMIHRENGETLAQYLEDKVFAGKKGNLVIPNPKDVAGVDLFMKKYHAGLTIERMAVDTLIGSLGTKKKNI